MIEKPLLSECSTVVNEGKTRTGLMGESGVNAVFENYDRRGLKTTSVVCGIVYAIGRNELTCLKG